MYVAYYCMVNDFPSQLQLNRVILGTLPIYLFHVLLISLPEVCSLLQCTRRSLGLMAGSKGELAGMVQIQVSNYILITEERTKNKEERRSKRKQKSKLKYSTNLRHRGSTAVEYRC